MYCLRKHIPPQHLRIFFCLDGIMSDTEPDQTQDDEEVEIIDLDDVGARFIWFHDSTILLPALPHLPLTRWSRLNLKQRVLRLAVTVGFVALALLIMLGNIAPVRTTAQGLFFRPTPTPVPVLVPGSDFFYIDASPSWGQLLLDGKRISHPPLMGWEEPLHLSRGRHSLVWSADPFRPLRCSISVPIAFDDTCHYVAAQQDEFGPTHPNVVPNSWKLLLYETKSTLPSYQRTALVQAIMTAVDSLRSTETIYPGERYVHVTGNHPIVDTATRPLQATLHFQLTTADAANSSCTSDPASCSGQIQGQGCQGICTQPGQSPGQSQGWFVFVSLSALWDYATMDGQIIAQNQSDKLSAPTTASVDSVNFELLQITWESGSWHVAIGFRASGGSGLACSSAFEIVNSEVANSPNTGYQMNSFSGSVEAAGCLVSVIVQPSNPATQPSSSAYYLYRFGVLLAVNDLAHHLSPHQPVVDAYERKLAQQLIQANMNP
jgi:hypothetical protein